MMSFWQQRHFLNLVLAECKSEIKMEFRPSGKREMLHCLYVMSDYGIMVHLVNFTFTERTLVMYVNNSSLSETIHFEFANPNEFSPEKIYAEIIRFRNNRR